MTPKALEKRVDIIMAVVVVIVSKISSVSGFEGLLN
jgi:hypothetical protein